MMTGRTTVAAPFAWAAPAFLLCWCGTAAADELADLRANQELLQRRIDQLAQVPPPAPPPGGPGGPVLAGSFPRSFVIPGTDVSLARRRPGRRHRVVVPEGAARGGALTARAASNEIFTDGQGGTGNLPGIPLNTHTFSDAGQRAGRLCAIRAARPGISPASRPASSSTPARRAPMARSRPISSWTSPPRTPTRSSTTTRAALTATSRVFARVMPTLGGLLMGQTQGTFTDNDSDPELLDFGGTTASLFVARTPQVRYTYPLAYGMSVAVSAENPNPNYRRTVRCVLHRHQPDPDQAACSALTTPAIT